MGLELSITLSLIFLFRQLLLIKMFVLLIFSVIIEMVYHVSVCFPFVPSIFYSFISPFLPFFGLFEYFLVSICHF